jgi:hypothetical protein
LKLRRSILWLVTTAYIMLLLAGPALYCYKQVLTWSKYERFENKKLITITLPQAALQWEEAGEELEINGSMFDVKQYSIANGIATLQGWYDDDEDDANQQQVHTSKKQQHKKNDKSGTSFFSFLYYAAPSTFETNIAVIEPLQYKRLIQPTSIGLVQVPYCPPDML